MFTSNLICFCIFFCLHTTFAISCPPFNTTILLHYKWSLFISLYDVEKNYSNTIELFRFVILQNQLLQGLEELITESSKKILYPCASFSDHMILYLAKE